MLDRATAPALLTPSTIFRIRDLARTMSDVEIAACLHWDLVRLQRTARAHGIEVANAAPRQPAPAVEPVVCRTTGHGRGQRIKNGEPRGSSFSLALAADADEALRRECHTRGLSMARVVSQLVQYAEENELWDTVLG